MYEDKTPEAIKAAIIEAIQPDWDTREGSFIDDMLGPAALEISKVYDSLNATRHIVWVDETSGEYLDMAAADLGIEPRKPGTKAQVQLLIAGEDGYIIPAGTSFLTADNYTFLTKEAATIVDGAATVDAEAKEVGTAYNVPDGAVTLQFSNASQITAVTNPAPATGGTDAESDESLFKRIDLARKKPRTSGNIHDYEEWALETPGVGSVKVFPLRDGRGTVTVLVADAERKPLDQSIVDACQAHIEAEMPIGGVELTVITTMEESVDVSATITTDGSATVETIQAAFVTALEDYFAEISLAANEVVYNRVGAILIGIPGVTDYGNLLLNGQSVSVVLADNQVPVVGAVTIT